MQAIKPHPPSARLAGFAAGLAAVLLLSAPVAVQAAATFVLPANGDNVVGDLNLVVTGYDDTLVDIGQTYSQGYIEMQLANPGIDLWVPGEGTEAIIPTRYVLPNAPREGIVVNVPEMRLYYYPKPKPGEPAVVITYPVSIGRQDWVTPHGVTTVVRKDKDPAWYPPASIRKEHAEWGDVLPTVVPPGPDNPLGPFALRLGMMGYLIHGTDEDKQRGIGMRVTHGCMRMYNKDVEQLFKEVPVGTPVRLLNQPYKVGLRSGQVFVEAHPYLEEDKEKFGDHFSHVVDLIAKATPAEPASIDWSRLRSVVRQANGIPISVGEFAAPAAPGPQVAGPAAGNPGGERPAAAAGTVAETAVDPGAALFY